MNSVFVEILTENMYSGGFQGCFFHCPCHFLPTTLGNAPFLRVITSMQEHAPALANVYAGMHFPRVVGKKYYQQWTKHPQKPPEYIFCGKSSTITLLTSTRPLHPYVKDATPTLIFQLIEITSDMFDTIIKIRR